MIVTFQHYSFCYAGGVQNALTDIDWTVAEGEITILAGASGSGKTTLLKAMKEEIAPAGNDTGHKTIGVSSQEIAMVFQNPETQLVCGSVKYDLVFHMENIGFSRETMKRRLSETCCYFGIEPLLHKKPHELSGGQKQLIALCATLMVQPKLLLLDEPLSQLDPIATVEFLELLKRINEEFGVTIVMSEHRLSECIAIADQLAIMAHGKIVAFGAPRDTFEHLWHNQKTDLMDVIPAVTKASLQLFGKACLLPKELKSLLIHPIVYTRSGEDVSPTNHTALRLQEIVFSYEGNGDYVFRRLNGNVAKGSLTCMLGGNGSGKSTLLKLIGKIQMGYWGKIHLDSDAIGYMPQTVNTFFSADNVYEEIIFPGCDEGEYAHLMNQLEIAHLEKRHPYDLSGGEAARVCLASILLKNPKIILLDEPTRGLDLHSKKVVAQLLKERGATVLMATHDLEFAAQFADRCLLLFDGDIVLDEPAHSFFKKNRYYTTAIHKGFRHRCEDIVTTEDVMGL